MSTHLPKRQKIAGELVMKSSKEKVSWPLGRIPLELFTHVCHFLPRTSVQNMRLVNKEFEDKVSAYLFQAVVVPFRPEIYGLPLGLPTPVKSKLDATSQVENSSVMIQDNGMRIFQGFGQHIRKFALAFEFDEAKLAKPPLKNDQQIITSFWGIYNWPHTIYNRYSQLEMLEQTADETLTMTKAMSYVTNAIELGLSVDGGLGWLAGPDINPLVALSRRKLRVFGSTRFAPEPKPAPIVDTNMRSPVAPGGSIYFHRLNRLSDGFMTETQQLSDGSRTFARYGGSTSQGHSTSHFLPTATSLEPISEHSQGRQPANVLVAHNHTTIENLALPTHLTAALEVSDSSKGHGAYIPLKPNALTMPQREMLLELEWAQRAFLQSFSIAVIDCSLTFDEISILTISCLPSRHLPILDRGDFWNSLPQLEKLSLAIIPDWREITKLSTSSIQDTKKLPSESVYGVHKFLRDQIVPRQNITTLHFEWLCGGENAPGLLARNQHILVAPLVASPAEMFDIERLSVLAFPYVEQLSLKNCWMTPTSLGLFGSSMNQLSLRSLTLDSVSLTAPVTPRGAQPLRTHANFPILNAQQTIDNGAHLQIIYGHQQGHPNPVIQVAHGMAQGDPGPAGQNNQTLNNAPRPGSWPQVIGELSPSPALTNTSEVDGSNKDLSSNNENRKDSLEKLVLDSCGYIRLLLDFDQTMLDPAGPYLPPTVPINRTVTATGPFMMSSTDPYLGVIINHINPAEIRTLEDMWGLTTGWGEDRADDIAESKADGIRSPGQGRFNGVIEAIQS